MLEVAVALIWHDDAIMLVQQQGPRDPQPAWALPGGVVEGGELLTETLRREVREEAGLEIDDAGHIAYTAQFDTGAGTPYIVTAFAVARWNGQPAPNDPDGHVIEARFVPRDEALQLIGRHQPWRVTREPLVAYLRNQCGPGACWLYREYNGDVHLLDHLRGATLH